MPTINDLYQSCVDTGCCLEDKPGAIDDWNGLLVGVREIELFNIWTVCKQMTSKIELLEIELLDHLTVCDQMIDVNRIVSDKSYISNVCV